jgi:hypothetical protein
VASVVAVLSAGSLSARDSSLQLDPSCCRSHVPVQCDSFFAERLVLLALSVSCGPCCHVGLGLRFLIAAKASPFSVCMCGLLQDEVDIIFESPD